jgi:cation diffusion facilitator family transporter
VEGALILVAAVCIAVEAWGRLLHPQPLQQVGLGLGLSLFATAINGSLALGNVKGWGTPALSYITSDAHHLLTDVWTTVGVVVGLFLVKLTGWLVLDPIIALIVAVNIVWAGVRLLRETGSGLLDASLPAAEQKIITDTFLAYQDQGIQFHALRTRVAGTRRFVSFHVLVPGQWTVQRGHDLCEAIELAIIKALPDTHVMSHLEPLEDPVSWDDQGLERITNTL